MTSGRTKRNSARDNRFFRHLAATGHVTASARVAGYARSSVFEYRDADPEFRRRWCEALEIATDALEAEARRRAFEGVEEPVFYQGEVCGAIKKYSDRLLECQLRAHRPAKYRDTQSVEHSGPGGGPITSAGVGAVNVYLPANHRDEEAGNA